MSDPLPSAEKPKNQWLGAFTWISILLGGFGLLSLVMTFYILAHPVPREEYVAPESSIAHAYVARWFGLIAVVMLSLGALVAIVVRLAKRPLNFIDRCVLPIYIAGFVVFLVWSTVAKLL